jgi:hypothetical protein
MHFFIGLLFGVVLYGLASNGWDLTLIIPVFLIHQCTKMAKQSAALEHALKKRNLG